MRKEAGKGTGREMGRGTERKPGIQRKSEEGRKGNGHRPGNDGKKGMSGEYGKPSGKGPEGRTGKWSGRNGGRESAKWENRDGRRENANWEDKDRGKGNAKWEDTGGRRENANWSDKNRGRGTGKWEDRDGRRGNANWSDKDRGKGTAKWEDRDGRRGTAEWADKDRRKGTAGGTGKDGGRNPAADRNTRRQAGEGGQRRLCPVSAKCGGCQWINISYEEQLQVKSTRFRRLMEPYCRPEPIILMEEPIHYRNKVHAVFGEDRSHHAISGIYEGKSHRIVPVDSCLIENQKADEIIVSIRGLLRSFKIRPYNEDTGIGLLRHVLVRVGHATGQIMVVLVLGYPVMPSKKNFVKALLKLHPEITTIVVNVNDKDTSMVLGEKEQVIYGKGYIEDKLCGMTFRISPKSFYQVNPVQTRKLYEKVMEYAGLTGKETVLDAYCGTGTIGMIASRQAAKVLGVELNREAVRDAVSNAKRNQISNIRFYQKDAGEFLREMAAYGDKPDVLLMDPPRSGSSEEFLQAAVRIRPRRIVYVSCNPETLVRDLKILVDKGYRAERCVALDMFPHTEGTEAVVALSLQNPRGFA